MIDNLGVEIGSIWLCNNTGAVVVVVGKERTGHQYDRYYDCACLNDKGKIVDIEDFMLVQNYKNAGSQND